MDEFTENSNNNDNLKEIIEIQNSTINKLKSQIEIYKIQVKEQTEKISSCDHLIIDYNSLYNNYIKLEEEFFIIKSENNQLKSIINSKNKTLKEYQFLFSETKSRFILYDKLNESLQNKIKYLESKLNSVNIAFNNIELDNKINEYYLRIQKIKDEYNKKMDILNQGLDNDYNNLDFNNMKLGLNINKKINVDLLNNKDSQLEDEKYIKNLDEYNLRNKKLEEEIKYLKEVLLQKDKTAKKLISEIKEEIRIKDNENRQKENIVKNLIKEKEELLKKINNKEVTNFLVENNYKKKYDDLKSLINKIEKEKNNNKNKEDLKINIYKDEISRLKNEINKCFLNDKINIEKIAEIEKKFKNMTESVKMKEDRYKKEISELNKIIDQLKKEKIHNKENESNNEIMRQNIELIEKNKNLAGVVLGLRNYIKQIENDKSIGSCSYNNGICCNCINNCEHIIELCCDCHCLKDLKYSSNVNKII